jgi:hypothetical protein
MLAMNDPVARELAARFDPVRMPNLRLSEQDADDLISFLHRENAKLVEAPAPAAAARAQALKFDSIRLGHLRSSPRKRGPRAKSWMPAFAGMSGFSDRTSTAA